MRTGLLLFLLIASTSWREIGLSHWLSAQFHHIDE